MKFTTRFLSVFRCRFQYEIVTSEIWCHQVYSYSSTLLYRFWIFLAVLWNFFWNLSIKSSRCLVISILAKRKVQTYHCQFFLKQSIKVRGFYHSSFHHILNAKMVLCNRFESNDKIQILGSELLRVWPVITIFCKYFSFFQLL